MKVNKKIKALITGLACIITSLSISDTCTAQEYKSTWQYYSECKTDNSISFTYDEFMMMCTVVQVETSGVDIEWAECVAGTIYNRVKSELFPNTIYEVLHSPNQYTTISKYYNGNVTISDNTYQAVSNILSGESNTLTKLNGAVFYCNPNTVSKKAKKWFDSLSLTYSTKIKTGKVEWKHNFYK